MELHEMIHPHPALPHPKAYGDKFTEAIVAAYGYHLTKDIRHHKCHLYTAGAPRYCRALNLHGSNLQIRPHPIQFHDDSMGNSAISTHIWRYVHRKLITIATIV